MNLKSFLFFVFLFNFQVNFALVDYTDPRDDFKPQSSGAATTSEPKVEKAPVTSISKTKTSSKGKRTLSGMFNSGIYYGSKNIDLAETSGKLNVFGVDAEFFTPYNIFLRASYFQGKVSKLSSNDPISSDYQKGNPQFLLGFNWLEFGEISERATIDLYGGMSFGQKDSFLATERSDKIVGISTAKRFHEFALGFGLEYILTGISPDHELEIGNVTKVSASIGWMVSNDIKFLVEAHSVAIGSGDNENHPYQLQDKIKFSTVGPKVMLGISPLVNLTLAANVRTRRIKNSNLLDARLYSQPAAYGNEFLAGLSFNL